MEKFNQFLLNVENFFKSGIGNVILFFCVAIFGLILIKLLIRCIKKIFAKSKINNTVAHFITVLIKLCLYVAYVITLLSIMGVPITSFIAILTALSLAVTLAIQNSLSNLTNGMVILANKTYKEGDVIDINGVIGTVEHINMMNTKLLTGNNEHISIPHNIAINAILKTYDTDAKRRIDLTVSVSYDSDVELVKKILVEIANNHSKILKNEIISARVNNMGASSIDFAFRSWTMACDYWDTRFDINEEILKQFKINNIEIPYQKVDINLNSKTNI